MTEIEKNTGEDAGVTREKTPAPAEAENTRPTLDDWERLAGKEVQGRDLIWHTPEGIGVKPLYKECYVAEPGKNFWQGTPVSGVSIGRGLEAKGSDTCSLSAVLSNLVTAAYRQRSLLLPCRELCRSVPRISDGNFRWMLAQAINGDQRA